MTDSASVSNGPVLHENVALVGARIEHLTVQSQCTRTLLDFRSAVTLNAIRITKPLLITNKNVTRADSVPLNTHGDAHAASHTQRSNALAKL